jgi:uncharacterized protein (TIGR02246 family)
MIRKYQFLLLTLIGVSLLGCSSGKVSEKEAMQIRSSVTDAVDQYEQAVNNGNLDSLLSLYADSAAQVAPSEPLVNGINAIRSRAEANHADYAYDLSSQIEDVKVANDLAMARASYTEVITSKADESDIVTTVGTWMLTFQKQDDGSWKIVTEAWNDETPLSDNMMAADQ